MNDDGINCAYCFSIVQASLNHPACMLLAKKIGMDFYTEIVMQNLVSKPEDVLNLYLDNPSYFTGILSRAVKEARETAVEDLLERVAALINTSIPMQPYPMTFKEAFINSLDPWGSMFIAKEFHVIEELIHKIKSLDFEA